ncbi:MAG: selenide, water dikinase SelD [Pegethrix bostrychoides GSE-TBD4-15B]|jgi:selenide,water dikinase|uniref:Selenide, water dikinase SelD n=1 Tax=Pegethrix bostrychoides GSE-TBD4-15B TaxID=2839662 RepID=A0A951U645_9CYAN|nr:selenide, water dikinase SelD [Pegethrix bostrychoides GSE-TBD4-15B]
MQQIQPLTQHLVLIGGGHSHAIALKQLGMKPIPGLRITLISDVAQTPYSGMLPGYVAGLYDFDACHIDLRPLCQFAGAALVRDRAVGLDLEANRVLLANQSPVAFDLLSLDLGSTPAVLDLPGAAELTIPVKPISRFLSQWDQLVERVRQQPQPLRLAVVGGGAGGVELTLAIHARLTRLYTELHQPSRYLELHLLHRGRRLVPERAAGLGRDLEQILSDQGVRVHLDQNVSKILAGAANSDSEGWIEKKICCESGMSLEVDQIFWVTQAAATSWLAESGLATDERGFVQVNDCLQSVSHPQVLAAGDVATMVQHPRPKAGVFAVRQGKPLVENLRRAISGQALQPFTPQKEFLILLGTGNGTAFASRGGLSLPALPLLWHWKDRIDRNFMAQFNDLKPMAERAGANGNGANGPDAQMPCAGCGSKVGSSVLQQALTRIQPAARPDLLIGLAAADDAAVLQVPAGQVMVQTVDYFRALISDPFLFGQIAANHCLSDLFAMGAEPQSALAIVSLPYAAPAQQAELLYQLLSGAELVLSQAGAALVGGHTTLGHELAFGLTCNGLADPAQLWRKGGMQPHQALILTKPLGTGTLFAAEMQLKAQGRWIEAAIDSMRRSNQAAVACLRQHGATACTDVTGFGLLGHLLEMLGASGLDASLDLSTLPLIDGAETALKQGIFSSLHPQNARQSSQISNLAAVSQHPVYPILFDPQTSGGLLAALPLDAAPDCLDALKGAGYDQSAIIGQSYLPSEVNPTPVSRDYCCVKGS